MTGVQLMRFVVGTLLLVAAVPALAQAQAPAPTPAEAEAAAKAETQVISIVALQGVTISGVVNYAGRFRTHFGESASTIAWSFRLKIGPGATAAISHTRNVSWQGKDGPKTTSISKSATGKIGLPKQTGDGAALWLLEGNTLVLLRVFEVGGIAMRIALKQRDTEWSCSVTAPVARETGAGATKTKAAVGAKVEMLNIRQTSSSCRVNKVG